MRSTAPPSRKAGHVGSLSGHAAQITDLRTPSWSSGAAHPPGGTSRFPPSLWRSTASKGRFLNPLVVPWLPQYNHPYTSPTRGRASSPRGSGTVPQSRSQGRAPSAPRASSPCCPGACGADAAPPPPPPRRGHPRRLRSRRGGGWLVLGSWGLGGDKLAGAGVDVVEVVVVVVVVVGVVRRHLLDAGGDAPHRLHVRLRGRPAPRPPPQVSHPLVGAVPRMSQRHPFPVSRLSLADETPCVAAQVTGAMALRAPRVRISLPVAPVPVGPRA